MKFNISYDFAKFQPTWGATLRGFFGPNNEGVLIEAKDATEAIGIFCIDKNINPFYIKVKAVK
jgi:hypothetical protein